MILQMMDAVGQAKPSGILPSCGSQCTKPASMSCLLYGLEHMTSQSTVQISFKHR